MGENDGTPGPTKPESYALAWKWCQSFALLAALAELYSFNMASTLEVGSLIDRDPEVRGGRPKIAGTGVTMMRVAGWYAGS